MRRNRLLIVAALGFGVLVAVQPGCSKIPDGWPEKPGPRVLTSFAPIQCFALNVAGDDAAVQVVMSGEGPHGFEPSARDMVKLDRADVFLINGLMLDDDIANKMVKGTSNKSIKVVKLAERIPESTLRVGGVCRDESGEHRHGTYDPHVWLGIPEAIVMVEGIRDALVAQDPGHKDGYTSRAAAYVDRLKKLEADGKEMLKDKKERKLITFHDSLFYFARPFGLKIEDSIEPAPGSEASAKHMSQLIEKCRTEQIRHITVEPQYPSNNEARAVKTDLKKAGIDAEFVEIDTIETAKVADLEKPDLYERKMRENLKHLADQLK
jgi:ABC-type Zn uptake system ZnuABC Zn-binding protein ZnuA